jgi:hypothetical protein
MLQRGFIGAFDIKPDKVALATSATNAASIGADLQSGRTFWRGFFRGRGTMGSSRVGIYSQISKQEVVVRHIGKDATVLYEFKKPVDIMERS